MTKRFIGGAWPYANGSLHLGHIAGLIQGDVLARYFRLKGDEVLYVSGSDCHGTPISIRAAQEGVSPQKITDTYHNEFNQCFEKLGFSYDVYSRTDCNEHHDFVKDIFINLYKDKVIYPKIIEQTYCEECKQFLPDRFIEGICPHCGNVARGDQCDFCSSLLEPLELKDRKCKICGNEPVIRETEHLFLDLKKYQKILQNYLNNSHGWRENSIALTERYLKEGLVDRAVTRDLPWGVDVPIEGFEGKKVYVWVDAVCGYMSASKRWADSNNMDWKDFWSDDVKSYFIHGKDNIPFHSLILPAILNALDLHLPDYMVSSEYLTIEGKKLSTSRNWAVWVPYILDNYNADSIRYFLIANAPEKRDGDFSWREFIHKHNGELLGGYGNFVNRTLAFIKKSFNNTTTKGKIDKEIEKKLLKAYKEVGAAIENFEIKKALEKVMELVRDANKYFDEKTPWVSYKNNKEECENTLYTCVQIIANLTNLLEPFVPFSTEKIRQMLNINNKSWNFIELREQIILKNVEILFQRIDKDKIEEEVEKLKNSIK